MNHEFLQTVYVVENWEVYSYDANMLKRASEFLMVPATAEINETTDGQLTFGKEWIKL